eukprot:TRINITY_DN299_c0_g1_i1.p1 TRINITY_DN299_c0_g1~~TRINITY_DN299_c0_g1_i1.p1  ORF type:complete len:102 (+),score=12.59 TRINITY_DN299_c0_g1_i1:234-539(+)
MQPFNMVPMLCSSNNVQPRPALLPALLSSPYCITDNAESSMKVHPVRQPSQLDQTFVLWRSLEEMTLALTELGHMESAEFTEAAARALWCAMGDHGLDVQQ